MLKQCYLVVVPKAGWGSPELYSRKQSALGLAVELARGGYSGFVLRIPLVHKTGMQPARYTADVVREF